MIASYIDAMRRRWARSHFVYTTRQDGFLPAPSRIEDGSVESASGFTMIFDVLPVELMRARLYSSFRR